MSNLDWQPPSAALAALSDHPEKVDHTGGLFFGGLTELRPLQFQYYHLGLLQGSEPRLSLIVTNPGSEEALLHLRTGVGKPSLDYFSTGHGNNLEWFRTGLQSRGEFFHLAPGAAAEVFTQELPYDHVVSGTLGLTLVSGPALQFALVARSSAAQRLPLNNLLKEGDVHSRGFYPAPYQSIERNFRWGDPELNIAVGAVRQQTFSGVKELRGDYGVVYQAQVHLVNPTDRERTFQLSFNPRGGAATATFLVNDKVVEVAKTEAFEKRAFYTVKVPPQSQDSLELKTVPEGASSYPVRIVVEGR